MDSETEARPELPDEHGQLSPDAAQASLESEATDDSIVHGYLGAKKSRPGQGRLRMGLVKSLWVVGGENPSHRGEEWAKFLCPMGLTTPWSDGKDRTSPVPALRIIYRSPGAKSVTRDIASSYPV